MKLKREFRRLTAGELFFRDRLHRKESRNGEKLIHLICEAKSLPNSDPC